VLTAAQEQALRPDPNKGFRECAPEQGKDYCPEMIVVPTGSFLMGSPPTEEGRFPEEEQHAVSIAKPFAVSKFEVTFDEWDTCVAAGDCPQGVSDSGFGRGQQPLIYVTFDDAQSYVAWLSKVTGKPYRLLSEAEYEYAARGGTQTVYPWGDDIEVRIPLGPHPSLPLQLNFAAMANCNACGSQWDNKQTAPVGSFAPNQFGLYDMVGNVFEWVEDCYQGDYDGAPTNGSARIESTCPSRVVRGGPWNDSPAFLRSASRFERTAANRDLNLGFRVARTLVEP
jgi:formylglycine-generating enzyme required for sulfatase activity